MILDVPLEKATADFPGLGLYAESAYFPDTQAVAFCESDGAKPLSLAVFRRSDQGWDVLDIRDIRPEGDDKRYGELLGALIFRAKKLCLPISLRFFEDRRDYETLCRAASCAGFVKFPGLYSAISHADEAMGNRWEDFKKKRGRFFERLAAKGYRNIPLTDIAASDRAAIYSGIKKEYNYDAEAAARQIPADEENCFFAFRASRLAAFCFVLRPSPTQMIFDFGGANHRERYSGVFLMPLSAFISKTYRYPETQTIIYLFHENNAEMVNLARHTLSIVIDSTKYKANFFYSPRGGQAQDERYERTHET
ncbi:MAG: hypothetical protein LBS45_08690 [Synergistaceae bacterium]|jgi:hypothetical protein|nr:hypothetical protein [Synergistaceae bacterium]